MKNQDPLRHHEEHQHLHSAFGKDLYGRFAEKVARSMGTPVFLIGQSTLLALWIVLNGLLLHKGIAWDLYPFILLNLMLSFQAAYSAPLILVAANRQADRDEAQELADIHHREDLHAQVVQLINQNTEITQTVHRLIEAQNKRNE